MRLAGRIALVTCAQQGIGEVFGREGARVAVNWLDDAEAGARVASACGLTDTAQPRRGHGEAELAERVKTAPIARLGQPYDIAELACFLACGQSSRITGQVHHINGGLWMP